ncbi:Gfo/Idh/MocA family protein [Thalassobacillus pellis]|uniref:Gfo/Idh/MocA family protein n=1 Tax=Thalassobacillus pellis TaxID=748008 RepID=UPI001EF99C77|nr:Gfo/Idh/MocA family oxidoreductase [Thalassobacillus pellis]MBM7554452.1 putative dehydrogenase [Thalassobacillus pellis]
MEIKKGKELKSKYISRNSKFDYLPEHDRYLTARAKPKYKFNVIGTGNIGQEHMKVTMLEERGTIHGIYDTNTSSIEQAKQMFSTNFPGNSLVEYDSLEAACNDPEVDGLIICTPNYTHIDMVREAVKSGKHILLEKPMATTLEDAFEITRIAQNYTGIFQIGLQYRYKAIYVEAIHEALERKNVGDIKTISILEHRVPFLDKVNQWNKFAKYSGGTLVEKCCHYFDLFNLFAQSKPVHVHATGSMAVNFTEFEYNNEKSDIIDNAFVTVSYENGIQASFNLCMFSPMFLEEMILCGDEGRMKVSEQEDFLPNNLPRYQFELMRSDGKPSKVSTPSYPETIQQSGHGGATFYEHAYFIDNIEGKQTSTASVEEGFWSVAIGAAAEKSIRTGEVVYIEDLLKEHNVNLSKVVSHS